MKKAKILKKLPKTKQKNRKIANKKILEKPQNKFTDKYLEFYDDIKIPPKRYDW